MKNFLCFRTMIAPMIIQILFWSLVIACIGIGLYNLLHEKYRYAIEIIILGPIVARLAAEFLLVIFDIHRSLLNIEKRTEKSNG